MDDESCAYLLDILIGEMMLKEPPSILDYRKNPLCPILQIQGNTIPTVYIPFLSAESVSNHLSHIRSGHNFLPLEVEESYLNNGKFNFHCGKSCLFTTSSGSSPTKGLLEISILNSFCFPPTKFGKCQHKFNPEGEIKGKLEFYNSKGIIVAFIGISISIKVLGHGVALHSNKLQNEKNKEMIKKYILAENINEERYSSKPHNIDSFRIDRKKFSNIIDHSLQRKESVRSNNTSDNVFRSINHNSLSKYECSYEPLKTKNDIENPYMKSSKGFSSEEIALQLAELENDLNFVQNDNNLQYYEFPEKDICKHPPSITYSSTDKEGELEWNRKFSQLISMENEVYEENFIKEKSKSLSSSSSSSFYTSDEMYIKENSAVKGKHKTDYNEKQTKRQCNKAIKNKPKIKGWLRSTPLVTRNTTSRQPQAKQTRTTLLRKSKTDPELAKQMQLEIERQVKQKLKILDTNFKSEMEGFKQKRTHRNKLLHDRLSSSKNKHSSEQIRTPIVSDLQNQHFVDSKQGISSENIASSQSPLHQKEIESKFESQRFQHNDHEVFSKVSTDKHRDTFSQPNLNSVIIHSDPDSINKKMDSRQLDSYFLDDTSGVKKNYPSGSSENNVYIETYPEEASIGESLLSDSTKQHSENDGYSDRSQMDTNKSKISDEIINYHKKVSKKENRSSISYHSESISRSEPKKSSSRSSTNKLRDNKIHDSYRNLSNSVNSDLKQKNKTLDISRSIKGESFKSSSHKSKTNRNKKKDTLLNSNDDHETESQATDISEDIPVENNEEFSLNSSQSNSSNRVSTSSDMVPSEGAITADNSSVESHISSNLSRIDSVEEEMLNNENDWKQNLDNSLSINKERNSDSKSSSSDSLHRSVYKYSHSVDDSIKSPSSQENTKTFKNKKK
ncbi:unnamed protein product, partial [Meganyctiphanes norvegica]